MLYVEPTNLYKESYEIVPEIEDPCSVLLLSPLNTPDTKSISRHLISATTSQPRSLLVVSDADSPFDWVRNWAGDLDSSLQNLTFLPISGRSGGSAATISFDQDDIRSHSSVQPGDIHDLGDAVTTNLDRLAEGSDKIILFIDSLSVLLRNEDLKLVLEFMDFVDELEISAPLNTFYRFDPTVHNLSTFNSIKSDVDMVAELDPEGNKWNIYQE